MEIKIDNNIGNFEAYLVSPTGENLGLITNIISLDHVRRQIKQKQLTGYKLSYHNEFISIDRNGTLSNWPDELCYYTDILMDLI